MFTFKTQWFYCLFICPELIKELAWATDLKFGMRVEHVPRNKTKDLSDISANFWERWQNVLAYQIWGFNLVPLLWPIYLRVSIKLCRLSIGAVTPNWLNSAYHWPIVFTKILINTISSYNFVVNRPINIINKIIEC